MTVFDEWLSRKLIRGDCTLREHRTVEQEYYRIYGPRSEFAHIVLTGEPSDRFEYRSEVQWPTDGERGGTAVLDGILDELLTDYSGYLITKARFTLHAIKYRQVQSCPHAFYQAAREAVAKIVDDNMVWPWERLEPDASAGRPRG
jgi:hypothetical protein